MRERPQVRPSATGLNFRKTFWAAMKKTTPRVFLILCFGVITMAVAIPLIDVAYCRYVLAGAVESDDALRYRDGIAFSRSDDMPFTGTAYRSVCGGDCGFAGCSALHWYAVFENGKRTTGFLPKSGGANEYVNLSLCGEYTPVRYDDSF